MTDPHAPRIAVVAAEYRAASETAETPEDRVRFLLLAARNEAEANRRSCRWADGDHGPCGGPSNGRECWDHKSIGRGI